ncbi:ATPase family AAA domain-containing protein 5 [Silurus meridionalis]|nr:ATPase family AAA domain-containing protein 5 [Silurus meridionalis]
MAGLVAMAAVIEDFEVTQPCKKLRKDEEPLSPPPPAATKTITNYFLPLPKPVDKPFSPPRSNSFIDYFRKTPPAQEKTTSSQKASPLQTKELQSPSFEEACPKASKVQRQKRTRKPKEKLKLQEEEEQDVLSKNCILENNPDESTMKKEGCLPSFGSDTSPRLSPINTEICLDEEPLDSRNAADVSADDRKAKDGLQNPKSKNLATHNQGEDLNEDNASPQEDMSRVKKCAMRRNRKAQVSRSELSTTEHEQSLHDASMEVNVDETSVLNCSTVTVSFKDFLQSQIQSEDEVAADSKSDTCAAESSDVKSCMDVIDSVAAVSPRTLMVQAEVHPISPDYEAVKGPQLKMASIFTRNKKESQVKDSKKSSSDNPQMNTSILPDLKRKSNVVLQEEDLELAVLEYNSTSKCTQEERKQFMNAFKQPSQDGSKVKTSKVLSKLKPAEESASETAEPEKKEDESSPDLTTPEQCTEQKKPDCVGKKRGRKKSVKKGQTDQSEEVPVTPNQDELLALTEIENKSDSVEGSSKQCVKELRRSTRDQTRRQAAPTPERNPFPRKTRSHKKDETSAACQDDVTQASTPKSTRHKKNVYMAEMLSPSNKHGSPIRIRFTRVFPSSATKTGDFEILSPQDSNSLKKRKKAKKLVQKAKALKNSKQTAAGEKPAVRRSTRSKESNQISYCEDEDSVVFLDDCNTAPATSENINNQKKLRSLNDVLGKNIPSSKAQKNSPAFKLAPMSMERKSQRPSAIISILDDSSREGSENSQDDEQFRAKKEFLKSGLPESFKKQIAKVTANREAYTQACTSFQSVVHVQQRPTDCSLWTLLWPENPFLTCLKEFYHLPSTPIASLEDRAGNFTVPAQRTCTEVGGCVFVSGRRKSFTEPVQERLLEEITASNPSFPVQRFFSRFQKRYKEYLQGSVAEPECGSKTAPPVNSTETIGGKRKRVDEGGRAGKLAKKQKSDHKEEEAIVVLDSPDSASGGTPEATESVTRSSGRRRRSLRNKQGTDEEPKPTEDKKQCDPIIVILDSPSSETCAQDCVIEDVPWTEKYQPQHSGDIIGNTASVRKLHSWLKEWKLRADREERRKQEKKKQEDDSNDSWLEGDSSEGLEDAEDMLCNTLLITGPTGVGKTAAVYACAQELGFKVFEVNCSSQRSGRQILSQLKEATQSHQVDIQGVNAHKPTYFNNYNSSSLLTKPSPRKVNSPRQVVSSPRKPPQSPRSSTARKGNLTPKSLASFFKMGGRSTGKDDINQDKKAQTSCSKTSKVTQIESKRQEKKASSEEQNKRTATSLILFEEVDVIFDDDSGFLAAVKTFMATTKRPVILTTSDPTFVSMFDGYFDEIHFKVPSLVNVASYLQLLCLVENVRTDMQDLSCLLHWNRCDIRQSLLHLQFWTCSGGGRQVTRPILQSGGSECQVKTEAAKVENVAAGGALPLANVPPCHVGCTESFLGLLNTRQEKGIEDLLMGEPSAMDVRCLDLLSEAERRGVNLLYSNMEVLIRLPTRPLPDLINRQRLPSNTEAQPVLLSKHSNVVKQEEHSDDTSPLKVSCRMRRKKQLYIDNKHALHSDSDSEDGFLSLPKLSSDTKPAQDESAQDPPANKPMRMRVELSEAERKKSQCVSQCLSFLAEYLDHMSFVDSSLHYKLPQAEGACRPQDFTGAGAEVKCGMTDDVRLEWDGHINEFNAKEIQIVLGSMSFHKCKAGISEVWNKVQELEEPLKTETVEDLTLHVASHRQRFDLSHSKLLEPRVMDTRREVMNDFLTSRSFSTQGNRVAAAVDYLPSLRAICRSEKLREQGKVKRRFMHYLEGIHLDLPKSTLQELASDFP